MNKKKTKKKSRVWADSTAYARLPTSPYAPGLAPIGEYGECADPLVVARRISSYQNPRGIRPLPEDRLPPFLRGETSDLPRRPPGRP